MARMSPFGIIEMTRQRLRPSLTRSTYEICRVCSGTGYVAKPETVSLAVVRDIRFRLAQAGDTVEVLVSPEIADLLRYKRRRDLVDLEDSFKKSIVLRGEPGRAPADYRVTARTVAGSGR